MVLRYLAAVLRSRVVGFGPRVLRVSFKKFSLERRTWSYGSMIVSQSRSLTTTFVKDFLPGYVMTHQMANVLGLELPVHNHSTAAKIGIGQVEPIWGCCQMETHRVGLSGFSCTATSYAL